MRGVTTHVSASKISTNWNTDLKKNPYTRGVAPSLLWILVSLFHTAHSLSRFLNTAVQPLSDAEITCPNYLKEVTIFRGHTYALKALDVTALSYSASRCRLFRSASFLHCAVRQCILLRDRHGTSMLHRGHCGWGRLHFILTFNIDI